VCLRDLDLYAEQLCFGFGAPEQHVVFLRQTEDDLLEAMLVVVVPPTG
jgi:hypothetical protein